MMNKYHDLKMILPGNSPGDDFIPVSLTNTVPTATMSKKPPTILVNDPVIEDIRFEDTKEVDAKNFPKIRGF